MFVEKGGARFLAHWIEYAVKSDRRTHVAVLKYVPTLLPRGAVAMGATPPTSVTVRVKNGSAMAARPSGTR